MPPEDHLTFEMAAIAAFDAESLVALRGKAGPDLLRKVVGSAPAQWMADTTFQQLEKVQRLLAEAQQ